MPARLCSTLRRMERHVPRLDALDRRRRRSRAEDRPQALVERRQDGRRRSLYDPAPLLGGNDPRCTDARKERSMSTIITAPTLTDIQAFLYREARLLDDEQWDEWLELYHPDA